MTKVLVDRALLEHALEALERDDAADPITVGETMDALRAALEQEEQCAEESDCTGMPWCRIRNECQRAALEQEEQEPVAWSTRERFYEALDRAVGNVRQEMRIKTVTMRRKDHDIALPIIDAYSGHVLVGDPPRREWQGLTEQRDELLAALRLIATTDPVDAALDPQRAVRVARAAIAKAEWAK